MTWFGKSNTGDCLLKKCLNTEGVDDHKEIREFGHIKGSVHPIYMYFLTYVLSGHANVILFSTGDKLNIISRDHNRATTHI